MYRITLQRTAMSDPVPGFDPASHGQDVVARAGK